MKNLILVAAAASLLSGCALLDTNHDLARAQSESNPAGAKGLLRGNELRALSIANLVGSFVPGWMPVEVRTPAEEQAATDKAIAMFYVMPDAKTEAGAIYRNEIQSRIMAAANQRCQLWKNYIATASSAVGFWSGIVGTATGAASIAFSPEGTKDALTAVSTTSNAVGDQFDKEYLFSLTMPVVVQGVESRRQEIGRSIEERRTRGDGGLTLLKDYPLSAAIADALEYHAACSVASGLQQASEKLADTREPEPGGDDSSEAAAAAAAAAAAQPGATPGEVAAAATAAAEAAKSNPAPVNKRTSSPATR